MKQIDTYVTGASGFIGQQLMGLLDPKTTVAIPHQRIPVAHLEHFKRLFYLAAYGNLRGQDNWEETVNANVLKLAALLLEARRQSEAKFIFVSSSSVTLKVQTPYSRCKRAAEELLLSGNGDAYQVLIARPYSITGVGEQREHLIPTLIRSCLDGEQMPFYPDAVHDYVDVQDFVEGLILMAMEAKSGIYEFGRGIPVTNGQVRALVEDATGKKASAIEHSAGRKYDAQNWYCRSHATQSFGWKPKITLTESIHQMVEAHQQKP